MDAQTNTGINEDQHPCFGCQTPIANTPGNAYCATCIETQTQEHGDEVTAFDAYHRFADRCVSGV